MPMEVKRAIAFTLIKGNIAYDVAPTNSDDPDIQTKIESFCKDFTIIGCRHITPQILEKDRPKIDVPIEEIKSPKMASLPTEAQREYSILFHMPAEYGVIDYVKYWLGQGRYDEVELKSTFSYANKVLREAGFVEIANPETNRTRWKYRVVATDEKLAELRRKLKSGEKVIL